MLAGIGTLTNAASRTIAIPLKRKRREERVETFRDAARGRCEALAARAHRWAAEYDAALRKAEPVMPECLDNRVRNDWEPILAVADAAGDPWPQIARAAAMALAGEVDETPTEGAMLLEDIRKVWLPVMNVCQPRRSWKGYGNFRIGPGARGMVLTHPQPFRRGSLPRSLNLTA